jgi:hypothetical protein
MASAHYTNGERDDAAAWKKKKKTHCIHIPLGATKVAL